MLPSACLDGAATARGALGYDSTASAAAAGADFASLRGQFGRRAA